MNNFHLQTLRVDIYIYFFFNYWRSLEPYWLTLVSPWADETFCSLPDRSRDPSRLPHSSPLGVQLPGCGVDHQPQTSAEVKERVHLISFCSFMAGYRVKFTVIIYRRDLQGMDRVCLETLRHSPLSRDSTPCSWADISRIRVVLRTTVWWPPV